MKYLTELGMNGHGRGINRSPESAIAYAHDIFSLAAQEKLDVYKLCGSLCIDMCDDLYKEITGRSFADSIRDVLTVGRNVSIFVWDDGTKEMSRECANLLNGQKQLPGKLEVRFSGTREHEAEINHFIIAKSRDTDDRWITRIEKPHPRPSPEQIRSRAFEVPAVLLFDTDEAKKYGAPLLSAFQRLVEAVDTNDAPLQRPNPVDFPEMPRERPVMGDNFNRETASLR